MRGKTIRRGKLEMLWDAEGPFAGVDEVGVSALAGPLFACAVILPRGIVIEGVRDSKTVPTHAERCEIAERIRQAALDFSFGECSPEEVSFLGTVQASRLAMKRAVLGLRVIPHRVVTDFYHLDLDSLGIVQENIVKADAKVVAVAAASIVAKAERDSIMIELDRKTHWVYKWTQNKGYRSLAHGNALRKHGLSRYHRRKYALAYMAHEGMKSEEGIRGTEGALRRKTAGG